MTARFAPGDLVRVRPGAKPGHVRTPGYLKGKPGRVEAVLGRYPNPEDLAYGLSGEPGRDLYKVGFGEDARWCDYEEPQDEQIYDDVYER